MYLVSKKLVLRLVVKLNIFSRQARVRLEPRLVSATRLLMLANISLR